MQEGRTFDRENFSKLKVTICGWAQKWREKERNGGEKNGGKKKAAGVRHGTFDTLKFKFPFASPDWLN